MLTLKQKLTCSLAVLTINLATASAQTPIRIKTEIEIRPAFLIRAYRPTPTGAEEKSSIPLVKEPEYLSKHPRYGKMLVGNAKDKQETAVVIDQAEGKAPRVYIDANNNRDLTDDGEPEWTSVREDVYFRDVNIKTFFMIDGKEIEMQLPYAVYRFSDEKRQQAGVFYYRKYGRSGTLRLKDKEYKVALSTFNNQGLYTDLKQAAIVIDVNRDGKLDMAMNSAEMFKGAEPFNIDGESYRIAELTEIGDSITLEISPEKVAPKRYFAIGLPAEDFEFQTLDGKSLKLSSFRGKVVMLDFWATWCGPCIQDLPDLKKVYNQFDRSKFEIIGISLDGKSTRTSLDAVKKFIAKNDMKWPTTFDDGGWGNAIAKIYRISGIPHQILVDQKGVIQLIIGGADTSGKKSERIREAIEKLLAKNGS